MLVLDRVHYDVMTGADRALQLEVLGLFRAQVAGCAAALAAGRSWCEAVHMLKGSACSIGLVVLAAACEAAEQAPAEQSAAALASVRAALQEALSALEQFAAAAA